MRQGVTVLANAASWAACVLTHVKRNSAPCVSPKRCRVPGGFDSCWVARGEFAEQEGCSKVVPRIEAALDCSVLCVSEPREACVAIYFNQGRKECRLILFTDATVDMGDARGWRKFALIK